MGLAHYFGPEHDRFKLDVSTMAQPAQRPAYYVDGLIREGTSTVLAGDSGLAKSTLAQALAIAGVQGGRWLGMRVVRGPVLYLHGEDPLDATADTLRALGLGADDEDLHYWRGPLVLSNREARRAVEAEIEEIAAKLVVIDSATMLSGVDPLDNAGAAGFMGWVASLNATTLTLHHEAKGGASEDGQPRSAARAKRAVLGAMQWTAQCDLLISLEPDRPLHTRSESADGEVIDEWRVRAQLPKQRRFGAGGRPLRIVKWSRSRADVLIEMEMRCEADVSPAGPARPHTRERLLEALRDGPKTRAELADACGLKRTSGGFKASVRNLREQGLVGELDDGHLTLMKGGSE